MAIASVQSQQHLQVIQTSLNLLVISYIECPLTWTVCIPKMTLFTTVPIRAHMYCVSIIFCLTGQQGNTCLLVVWVQESWYEKLNRWDEALEAYNRKYQETPLGSPANLEAALGRLRSVRLSVCLPGLSVCLSVCLSVPVQLSGPEMSTHWFMHCCHTRLC